jgi:hypothetical protein
MEGMTFIDSLTGFVGTLPPHIYKSKNAGQNWYITNIIGALDTIRVIKKFFFLTNEIGWAISTKHIMKTTDGGENWFVQVNAPGSGNFSGIHFVDSLFGWASISNRKPFKTTDGGENWIEQTQLSPNSSRDVFFIDTLQGFIVESGEFYQTSDGGNTFFLKTQVNGFVFARFSDFENQNIFLTGYKVYHSINNGTTWVDFPEVQGQWLVYMDLLNVITGFAVGNVGLIFKYFDESIPVELTVFSAELLDNSILLTWETATEINNQGFEIQRKEINDSDWKNIGFINGNGTTTEVSSYSFKDIPKTNGVYKYILKQIDYDGTETFSDIIEIEYLIEEYNLYQNFPNPFNSVTTINFSIPAKCNVNLSLYDVTGKLIQVLIKDKIESGNYAIEFNGSFLSSGIYFYSMNTSTGYQSTKKLIILK